jgi:tetratricopeptide (TPR) repeat protein
MERLDETASPPPEQTAAYRSDESNSTPGDGTGRLRPGMTLAGRFTILRFVARGGMGEVYEAQDQVARMHVALKLIRPELARSADAVERLRREVLLSRRVGHPNVCRIHEIYSEHGDDGAPLDFITMEFLEGETLADRLKRQGRLPLDVARPLVQQLTAGLQAAHAQGIVHRDFKAGNVLLVSGAGGAVRAVITDFGIARAVEVESDQQLTGSGVVGTPEYMAPEQVTGDRVGPATDVYALGVVVYQMLTGELPFRAATPMGSAVRRLSERATPPRSWVPELDQGWNRTILRCLEREPAKRPTTAELLTLVERPATPWRPVSRRKWLMAGLALAAVAAVVAGVVRIRRRPRAVPVAGTFQARPVFAVAGIAGTGDAAGPALAHRLVEELGAARSAIRVVSSRRLAEALSSLGIERDTAPSAEQQGRLAKLLGARWILTGELGAPNAGGVQPLQLTLLDTTRPDPPVRLAEQVTGSGLVDDGVRIGARLRDLLRVKGTPDQERLVAASRPSGTTAARHLASGWALLAASKPAPAQEAFAAASSADPGSIEAHLSEAVAWRDMGYATRARASAQLAIDALEKLGPAAADPARAISLAARGEDRAATTLLQQMTTTWPDDSELLAFLIEVASTPQPVAPAMERWRKALGTNPPDLRTVISEAHLKSMLRDPSAKASLEDSLKTAEALGARREQGFALHLLASYHERRPAERDALFARAEAAFHAAGALRDELAVEQSRIWNLRGLGRSAEMESRFRELIARYREAWLLGDAAELRKELSQLAVALGDLDAAEEGANESDAMEKERGLPPDPARWVFRSAVSMQRADPVRAREELLVARSTSISQGSGDLSIDLGQGTTAVVDIDALEECRRFAIEREGDILRETDRLLEAWSSLERVRSRFEQREEDRWFAHSLAIAQCGLLCDRGKTTEGLGCLQGIRLDEEPWLKPAADLKQAQCELAAHDFAAAEADASRALEKQRGSFFYFRDSAEAVRAQASAAQGKRGEAARALQEKLKEAASRGWRLAGMEVTLGLGRIELASGRGSARLRRLEQDARNRGMLRMARLAHESLDGKALASRR